jgi:uncharacterized membrane protein
MVGLGDLPGGGFQSAATGVSADGSFVVGSGVGTDGEEAILWDAENGMRSLAGILTAAGVDLTGWSLSSAEAISADGTTIVGSGTNPAGDTEAWVAVVRAIPEPSGLSLLLGGALLLFARSRR